MLKFRPSNLAQRRASISFNELQLIALIEKGLSDNSLRGYLYKRSSPNAKWRLKWFLLFENLLFYFDVGSSAHQHHQQQQQSQSSSSLAQISGKSPSRAFSSLIRRKQQNQPAGSSTSQVLTKDQTIQLQCLASDRKSSASSASNQESNSNSLQNVSIGKSRRASASETASDYQNSRPSSNLLTASEINCVAVDDDGFDDEVNPAANQKQQHQQRRQRLSSDPQATTSYRNLNQQYEQQYKTLNSSSISGVSGHFLAHNEQTIGRSTTTTAGKTATSAANYSSLLSRKIGVIFLEGSYCERLLDSTANFAGSSGQAGGSASNLTGCSGTKNCQFINNNHANGGSAYRCEHLNLTATSSSPVVGSARPSSSSLSSKNTVVLVKNEEESQFDCVFTLTWKKEGSKEYQFRTETEAECQTWVHAISNARYSTLLNDKEQLEQKYLHLSQIIESESTAKWQYSRQCEEFSLEIKKLRQEICLLKRQENRSNHLRLVLTKSAAIVDAIVKQQRKRQFKQLQKQQQQQQQQPQQSDQKRHSAAYSAGQEEYLDEASDSVAALAAIASTSGSTTTSPIGSLMRRARSIEQEQEEQELAVRRATHKRHSQQQPFSQFGQPLGPTLSSSAVRRHSDAFKCLVSSSSPSSRSSPTGTLRQHYSPRRQQTIDKCDGLDQPVAEGGHELEISDADEDNLSLELRSVVDALNSGLLLSDCLLEVENSEELRKIKKVQGFFRGWLCRRRWKQIVQEYIKSPHAESMRKRNNLVFRMVECEEEYVEQLTLLISAFLRPIKMAASSQRPALNHDELNSIFLNSETLLFLHQIFLKGLTARMESWPTLVLGDLFNMLLPMLTIYQEYVRNHHFSLQVLAECKQREQFSLILRRLEEKPQLNGRTLETFLTYPMHQIPRYIICLHEILAHTPHNHVERKSLYEAQIKLEDLSKQMHDEVSETENIRQNLAIERMIIGGCDILLDVNQGILMQVVESGGKSSKSRSRLTSFAARHSHNQLFNRQDQQHLQELYNQSSDRSQFGQLSGNSGWLPSEYLHHSYQSKELVRQCFLFTNHLLLCTRTKDGKLHLLENFGRISLCEITLIENPLEFIQQQETMIANLESIQLAASGPSRRSQQRGSALDSHSASNLAQADGMSASYYETNSGSAKRASTASVQSKLSTSGKRAEAQQNHVEFGDEQVNHHGKLDSSRSNFVLPTYTPAQFSADNHRQAEAPINDQEEQLQQPQRKFSSPAKSGSSRGRIAGYLATKLSNLTNLAGGAGNLSQQQQQSSSAPPSPLCKRSAGSQPSAKKRNSSHYSSGPASTCPAAAGGPESGHHSRFPFYLPNKDYGGCDFILILEAPFHHQKNSTASANHALASTSSGSATAGSSPMSSAANATTFGHQSSSKDSASAGQQLNSTLIIHLVAPNLQEKAAWMSDISQCIDNVHFNDLFHGPVNDSTSVTMNQSVRTDPRLYKDDVDIKFSRALNSCKLPQIRYASKERLFERLTDLRFLSIDFLNTFLLTYRVFTTAEDVLEALKSVHYNCDRYYNQQQQQHNQLSQPVPSGDSFSAFANSSLNSLNTKVSAQATTNVATDNQPATSAETKTAEVHRDSKGPANRLQATSKSSPSDKELASCLQKPVIPPRSPIIGVPSTSVPSVSAATNELGGRVSDMGQPMSKQFLLAPNSYHHQKRRSTISSLTPITGSNSSSLANLPSCIQQKAGSNLSSIRQHQQEPQHSDLTINSSEQLGELTESQQIYSNNEELVLMLSEDECLDKKSCPSRESFSPTPATDRMRSSSISCHSKPSQSAGFDRMNQNQSSATNEGANLSVPGGRQVRASSFSHLTESRNVRFDSRTLIGSNANTLSGNEHWRLSYKKTILDSHKGADNQQGQFLAPAIAARRASSSDANVTFHVTLEPPVDEMAGSSCSSATNLDTTSQPLCPVPPSTPIEQIPSPVTLTDLREHDKNLKPEQSSKKMSERNRPGKNEKKQHRGKNLIKSSKDKRTTVTKTANNNSTSGSSSSLIVSGSSSNLSLSENSTTSKSVITSQSESGLINSTSSSYESKEPAKAEVVVNGLPKKSAQDRKRSLKRKTSISMIERSFILKEIDLNEAKILDTSAESSSADDDDDDYDYEEQTHEELDIEDEEERSFKILTKLNSVKIDNSESDSDEAEVDGRRHEKEQRKFKRSAEHKTDKQTTDEINGLNLADVRLKAANKETRKEIELDKPEMPSKTPDQNVSDSSHRASLTSSAMGGSGVSFAGGSGSRATTPRNSFQHHAAVAAAVADAASGDRISKAGVIVTSTSPRVSSRRSSTASAASAFAAATAAANNPILTQPPLSMMGFSAIAGKSNILGLSQQRKLSTNDLPSRLSHQFDADHPHGPCLCSSFRRSSFSTNHQQQASSAAQLKSQQFQRPTDLTGNQQNRLNAANQQLHYPSCIYYNQAQFISASPSNTPSNSCPPNASDASSLCNSRASSRLSSCAGIEYASSSYQQQNANFYTSQQHQQFVALNNQATALATAAGPNQASPAKHFQQHQTRGSTASQLIGLGSLSTATSQALKSSKRNSSATQINIRSVATIRVLSVLRHWVSKHSQDFVNDAKLSYLVQEFLQDLIIDTNLLPAEHKAALQLQQMVQKAAHSRGNQVDLDLLLAPPTKPSPDSIETLSALEIAEGMTYLDHKIFLAIRSEEFLGQAWMKMDKAIKAPHILLITKRFNDVSRLVASEIIRVPELHRRVSIIEKWTNVAHICRVVHNFNGVLQICAAFTNSAVFRLKKTWDKIPKTTKTTIDQLQNLVSTDSRFRNMRDAINRCDPPSIPYVGMYLTDLSFIEEGTPNYSPEGLLNFSKMRMIAHVIREIQHLQNGSYKIELNSKVANYLLDASRHLQDDEMYRCSLAIEPRSSGGKNGVQILNSVSSQHNTTTGNGSASLGAAGANICSNNQQQQPNSPAHSRQRESQIK